MITAVSLFASALAAAAPAQPGGANLMPAFPDTSDRRLITRWLVDTAGFPAGAPVDLGPESAVLVETDSTAGLRAGLHNVRFREEAITADFVSRTGGRSISGSGQVDCNEGLVRAGALTLFLGTGLKGERVATLPAQETWRTPPAGGLFDRVVETVCDDATPPPPTTAQAAPRPPAAPPPTAAPGAAPVQTAPSGPVRTGRVTVQVGAFATREQARTGLSRATSLAAGQLEGRTTEVAAATVNNAQVYRALIHGFVTRSEAQAFCARLQARGQPCLVRP
jgi:hypothetical protein